MADEESEGLAVPQKRAWMAELSLPVPINQEFAALIPSQRMTVGMLMSAGTILSYTLSADRTRLWVVLVAMSEKEAQTVLEKFPILSWTRYTIHELFFHEMAIGGIPRMSLN